MICFSFVYMQKPLFSIRSYTETILYALVFWVLFRVFQGPSVKFFCPKLFVSKVDASSNNSFLSSAMKLLFLSLWKFIKIGYKIFSFLINQICQIAFKNPMPIQNYFVFARLPTRYFWLTCFIHLLFIY